MKYYIVLDPISSADPHSLFAQPRKFGKEIILTQFHMQSMAKLFSDEAQALHYARSLSKRGPKAGGCIAPIIECEREKLAGYEEKHQNCRALDGDPEVTKTNLISESVAYFEVPAKAISENTFLKAFFPKENMPNIDMRPYTWGCVLL